MQHVNVSHSHIFDFIRTMNLLELGYEVSINSISNSKKFSSFVRLADPYSGQFAI